MNDPSKKNPGSEPDLLRKDLQRSLDASHVDPLKLSPFQRILLTTDGTVTELLEAFSGDSMRVVKLSQDVVKLDDPTPDLDLPGQREVLRRTILLQGRISATNFLYAESLIALDRLDAGVRDGLLNTGKAIGLLILEQRIETFKEIVRCGRELARDVGKHFGIDADASLIARSYRMITNGNPIMLITEKFPESYYQEWTPGGGSQDGP